MALNSVLKKIHKVFLLAHQIQM